MLLISTNHAYLQFVLRRQAGIDVADRWPTSSSLAFVFLCVFVYLCYYGLCFVIIIFISMLFFDRCLFVFQFSFVFCFSLRCASLSLRGEELYTVILPDNVFICALLFAFNVTFDIAFGILRSKHNSSLLLSSPCHLLCNSVLSKLVLYRIECLIA